MGWFKRAASQPEAAPKLKASKDAPALPGQRLHHEYFTNPEPVNGRFGWRGRVYSTDGTAYEDSGDEPSHREACQAAIRWAESKKNELRRVP